MGLFQPVTNEQAYAKIGLMGFQGSGKTHTASLIASGLHRVLKERKLPGGSSPVFFGDTETGSDWVKAIFNEHGCELYRTKTRAFTDLVPMVKEVAAVNGILLLDSITHFWRELTESYAKKKNRQYGLQFNDWTWLKQQWGTFTDVFVNAPCHIIMCGRAGFEYGFFENDDGKKELEKTGIKMKAEGETGYEPSLLILMTQQKELDGDAMKIWRTATVLKDRGIDLDGKQFKNPTFKDFAPHFSHLNLGGEHLGVDTSRTSEHIVSRNERSQGAIEREQAAIALDEVKELLVKHYPSQSAEHKKAKGDLLESHFGTRSWAKIETYSYAELAEGRNKIWQTLEGKPYAIGTQQMQETAQQAEGVF